MAGGLACKRCLFRYLKGWDFRNAIWLCCALAPLALPALIVPLGLGVVTLLNGSVAQLGQSDRVLVEKGTNKLFAVPGVNHMLRMFVGSEQRLVS